MAIYELRLIVGHVKLQNRVGKGFCIIGVQDGWQVMLQSLETCRCLMPAALPPLRCLTSVLRVRTAPEAKISTLIAFGDNQQTLTDAVELIMKYEY